MSRIEELKQQIAQLDELIRNGVLTGEAAREARSRLETELLAVVTAPAAASNSKVNPAQAGAASPAGSAPALAEAPAGYSPGLLFGIVAFVLVFAAAGYAWLGNRAGLSTAPSAATAATAPAESASSAHAMGVAQIEGMIEKLALRLKAAPEDAEGWAMLGRSYSVLGRHSEALPAYQKVIELRPKDANGYADLADAQGSVAGRSLDGEPEKLINKALSLDPDNPKALFLSGTLAFNRGDAATAARQWEHALRGMDPKSEMAQQMQGALDEARQRAGLAPLAIAAAAVPLPGTASAPGAEPPVASNGAAASIQGRVSLSDKVRAKASPEDTVFIFARPVAGGRAPLAILRKQVKDLPVDFTLDDSLSMSPAMRLSTAREVVVGARVSKSGNAMPQPGDLQGLSATVPVGAKGIQIDINEALP